MRVVEGYANSKHILYFPLNSLIIKVLVKGDKKRPEIRSPAVQWNPTSWSKLPCSYLKENPVNAATPLKLTTSTF